MWWKAVRSEGGRALFGPIFKREWWYNNINIASNLDFTKKSINIIEI